MTSKRTSGKDSPLSRDDRLGAALRANLARRKAQARARAENQDEQQEGASTEKKAPESEE